MSLFVARKDVDECTGHDDCPPRKAVEGSPDVFIDGHAVVRVGDRWESHGCPAHPPHVGKVVQGSDEVSVNGIPVARIGDPLDCGSKVRTGSEALYAGGKLTAKQEDTSKSKAAELNEQLFGMEPGGPKGDFENIARARLEKAKQYQELARQIGEKYGVPPAMALAWMNRESAFGDFLNNDGYSKFDGQGFGLFQVDRRYHTPQGGPADWDHIDQAMGIFNDYKGQIKERNPGWTESEYNAAALVAYNSGPGNARTRPSSPEAWAGLDGGTAHVSDPSGDYSRDIWTEAQWYAKNLDW
jgi:uncharacterized Zn-binding protein involved in type VI secretion